MHRLGQKGRKGKKVTTARFAICAVKRVYGELLRMHHVWQWGRKSKELPRKSFHAICTAKRAAAPAQHSCCCWLVLLVLLLLWRACTVATVYRGTPEGGKGQKASYAQNSCIFLRSLMKFPHRLTKGHAVRPTHASQNGGSASCHSTA